MLLRNWFENLKPSGGLNSLKVRRRSPLRKRAFSACFQAAEVMEERRLLSAGALDSTFGSGGVASPTPAIAGAAAAIAVYSNAQAATAGDVVVLANVNLNNGTHEFGTVRYTQNGILDTSFGGKKGAGEVVTSFGNSYGNDYAQAAAVQGDGKVVVAGFAGGITVKGSSDDFALARLNVNGSLDSTFGSNGTVTTNFSGGTTWRTGSMDVARAAFIQPDGKIVLAGFTAGPTDVTPNDNNIALARYNANGTLDTTFGSGGKVTTSHTLIPGSLVSSGTDGTTQVYDAALQADGKILVAGYTQVTGGLSPSYEVFVARYNSNGTLDASFGTSGVATLPTVSVSADGAIAGHIAVEPGGEIVVTGFGQTALLHSGQAGYTDGSLDSSFGNNGVVSRGYGPVALEPNGDIVLGQPNYLGGSLITRFLPNGTSDTSFGTSGIVTLSSSPFGALAIQPDGKIDLAGSGFIVDRLLPSEPQIGSLKTDANPVAAGSNVTAIASNITDDNPGATITQVAFMVEDSSGTVLVQGYGTPSTSGPRSWSFAFSTAGWPSGAYTLFAQATDSYGVLGDSQSTSLTLL
jgi:uncharacterized delta-60 repeat protein